MRGTCAVPYLSVQSICGDVTADRTTTLRTPHCRLRGLSPALCSLLGVPGCCVGSRGVPLPRPRLLALWTRAGPPSRFSRRAHSQGCPSTHRGGHGRDGGGVSDAWLGGCGLTRAAGRLQTESLAGQRDRQKKNRSQKAIQPVLPVTVFRDRQTDFELKKSNSHRDPPCL